MVWFIIGGLTIASLSAALGFAVGFRIGYENGRWDNTL